MPESGVFWAFRSWEQLPTPEKSSVVLYGRVYCKCVSGLKLGLDVNDRGSGLDGKGKFGESRFVRAAIEDKIMFLDIINFTKVIMQSFLYAEGCHCFAREAIKGIQF